MRTKNYVDIIGFVGRDPERRATSTGQAVTHFTVATTERWADKSGQAQERTEWHRVVFFGRPAELVAEMVHKGHLIEVEGSLRSRSYDKDGQKRTVQEIRGTEFRLLERRPNADGAPTTTVDHPPADDVPPPDADLPL
jgi:single-strand DNA-binding protein